MVEMTVAMPCYNGKKIGWLSMESLCRQEKIDFKWELIVCEEIHDNMLGKDFFMSYKNRLKNVGCVEIKYLQFNDWVSLITKWKVIGKAMSETSKIYMLKAVDCYSQPHRMKTTYDNMIDGRCDWLDFDKGYFYSFKKNKVILYNGGHLTNLDMAMASKHAKNIPMTKKNKGIDGHLFRHCKNNNDRFIKKTIKGIRGAGIDTDGYNNISKKRITFYDNVRPPFIDHGVNLDIVGLPTDITKKIKEMLCPQLYS